MLETETFKKLTWAVLRKHEEASWEQQVGKWLGMLCSSLASQGFKEHFTQV